jgi:hypothetical protein
VRDAREELRARNRAAGLCYCGQKRRPRRLCCAQCIAERIEDTKKRYAKRRKDGVCTDCEAPVEDETTRCKLHNQKNREKQERFRLRWGSP